jgi:hypothetical protein
MEAGGGQPGHAAGAPSRFRPGFEPFVKRHSGAAEDSQEAATWCIPRPPIVSTPTEPFLPCAAPAAYVSSNQMPQRYNMITLWDREGHVVTANDESMFRVLTYMLQAKGVDLKQGANSSAVIEVSSQLAACHHPLLLRALTVQILRQGHIKRTRCAPVIPKDGFRFHSVIVKQIVTCRVTSD